MRAVPGLGGARRRLGKRGRGEGTWVDGSAERKWWEGGSREKEGSRRICSQNCSELGRLPHYPWACLPKPMPDAYQLSEAPIPPRNECPGFATTWPQPTLGPHPTGSHCFQVSRPRPCPSCCLPWSLTPLGCLLPKLHISPFPGRPGLSVLGCT